jgi:hypothetical protein
MTASGLSQAKDEKFLEIPLSYQNECSEQSALALVFRLRPEWEHSDGAIEIVRFKDGITNTVGLWPTRHTPGVRLKLPTASQNCQESTWAIDRAGR